MAETGPVQFQEPVPVAQPPRRQEPPARREPKKAPPPQIGLHAVRDGARLLEFQGAVLGAATSKRGSAPRWSELVVYRLLDGSYLISKIGRSLVAHQPFCRRVNHRMITWSRASEQDEFLEPRVPCPDCQPDLKNGLAPDTVLEVTRYRLITAPTAENAVSAMEDPLADPALPLPKLVRDVLAQCAEKDQAFARYCEAETAPMPLEKTTRTP
jgi:hypothetical protein